MYWPMMYQLQTRTRCSETDIGIARGAFAVGLLHMAKAPVLTSKRVVIALAVLETLTQAIAGDFVQLRLPTDDLHIERQITRRDFKRFIREPFLLIIKPFLRRTAIDDAGAAPHVVVAGRDQVGLGRYKVVAPVARLHVRHRQDQAGAAQPLQVGERDVAQPIVSHALRPGHADRFLLQAFAATVQVNLERIGFQIDQCRRAGSVEVGDPHARGIEFFVLEHGAAEYPALAEFTVSKIWPAFDFIVANAAQLGRVAAEQIAQKHQFAAGIAEQGQPIIPRLMGNLFGRVETLLKIVAVKAHGAWPDQGQRA